MTEISLTTHCSRTSTEQLELLRKVESRHIIKKVADDTATLRTSIGSAASSQVDTRSISSRQLSSVGETEFDFDDALLATSAYQAYRQPPVRPQVEASMNVGIRRGPSVGTTLSASDEGYASHDLTPSHSVSTANSSFYRGNSLGPNDSVYPDHTRSKSMSFGAQPVQNAPGTRRWASTGGGTNLASPGGSKRGKFFSALKRLNTSSRASLTTPAAPNLAVSPSLGSTRGRRGRESDYTTSIDLNTQIGRTAPDIVKAAQLGTRYDVERLIGIGHNIEECHSHSRRNALMVASHCGKEDIADLLIQNNAQLNRADASGSTAVHLAASRGHSGVVALLLMEAINLEAETRHGRTALWVSANNGHLQTTQLLLEGRARVNARADNQMTALHVAARQGDVEVASILVSYGADVDARDASMMTALHYACEGGYLNVIELLLDNKADIDVGGSGRKTPLICSAAAGQLLAVQLLIKRKAKFKSVDEGGMTAIHWAAFNGHVEVVQFLFNQLRGSLALKNSQGRTPLHLATMNSRFSVVEFLVRKNCPLETRCMSGLNSLHYACREDSIEIVRLLLISGADIESQVELTQQRPIHIAAAGSSVGLVRLLCEQDASLEARDAVGDRALCVASRHGHAAAVQELLKHGSPLHLRFGARSYEDSPLCLAAKGGYLPVVSLLMSRGASVLSKDEMGWSPVRNAAYYGHPDVLQALITAEPSAANQDYGFSPDSFGLSPDKIGFAPDAGISPERKRRVLEILNRSSPRESALVNEVIPSRQPPATPVPHAEPFAMARPNSYDPTSLGSSVVPAFSTPVNDPRPTELPGTLEQGLPSSRSTTPTHMHRGEQDSSEAHKENSNRVSSVPVPFQPIPVVHEPSGGSGSVPLHQPRPQIPSASTILSPEQVSKSLTHLNLQVETPGNSEASLIPEFYELDGNTTPRPSSSPSNPPPVSHSPHQEVVTSPRYIPSAATLFPSTFVTPESGRGFSGTQGKVDDTQQA
jgi:ankyrin repeat protein